MKCWDRIKRYQVFNVVNKVNGSIKKKMLNIRVEKVKLNKPTRGDVKKFKVYVKDPKTGNVKKVNFGHGGTSAKSRGEKNDEDS